ncbi:GGDEF domain-containing protein [Luteibacter aegosomatissinici]|uniref:GGDEF domain-containing protein n=1 Tax=Luteibacter aegosomatissinici TaxID=2911539 RepID=UPI001FF75E3E|nr:GGDEF domain-containing protein [Luteibacter aegosomatissinici]UPG94366.1 GGDEF domain-containing protein [Luteibacter aegosomatissinici]
MPNSQPPANREPSPIEQVLSGAALSAVFQPVIRVDDGEVVAYEGLIRCAAPQLELTPTDLLDLARARGRLGEFELMAAHRVAERFVALGLPGRLLVNLSAQAVMHEGLGADDVIAALSVPGLDLGRVTIELTERDIVENAARLAHALGFLRARGVRIALDDFGNGHSNFEMWNEIHPEVVKIDRYLINGLASSAERLAIVRALCSVAETLGADLVGEGVEDEADLRMLRELGIPYAQGFLIARPSSEPAGDIAEHLASAFARTHVPVPPQPVGPVSARPFTAGHMLVEAPPVAPRQSNDDVADIFVAHPRLHAVAVVDAGVPVGIINRRTFTERMAQPFARELYGRKPCTSFMHAEPLVCPEDMPLQSMADILRGEDQRYLSDGFVITSGGMYLGLGTGESLVRRVTEIRVEAARYANPLTFLPGNLPVTEHIHRLLQAARPFAVAYFDLDNFKPFNDQYGYFRGDEMIRLLAGVLTGDLRQDADFVGHIGGDDFMVVFQGMDWPARCDAMRQRFNASAGALFDEGDRVRGGIDSEDRHGHRRFFPITTVAVGVACFGDAFPADAEMVASLAASAKRVAKNAQLGMHVVEWRNDADILAPRRIQLTEIKE